MEKEKQALMGLFENIENVQIYGINFTKATYKDKNIIIALAGIGKVNAAHTTTLLIEHYYKLNSYFMTKTFLNRISRLDLKNLMLLWT